MLQQTQVNTVVAYYHRFIDRFPNVSDLAAADIDTVLSMWEGLGYYRRARQLHAAAQKIVADHDGIFPDTYADVLALPGIGRYTAGAILSIAVDARLPVVEANTLRLYSRLIGLSAPPSQAASQRLLWEFAESILPKHGSGRLNQAAMELGALICSPRNPDCPQCPLIKHCAACQQGLQDSIPGKVTQLAYQSRHELAIVLQSGRRYLIRRCQPHERWAGLWDFPRCEIPEGTDCKSVAAEYLQTTFGQRLPEFEKMTTIKHAVTKYRITLNVWRARHAKSATPCPHPETQWLPIDQLSQLPLSVTGRKIVHALQAK